MRFPFSLPSRSDRPHGVERAGVDPHARRRRRTWAIGLALALAVPLTGRGLLARKLGNLEDELARQAGVPCAIASVEAGLVGNLRLRGVRLGEMFAAEAIEASTSWRGLLGGALRIDEIRVEAPRLALTVDASGESDLSRVLARLAAARKRGPSPAASPPPTRERLAPPRRIVVSEGELAIRIADVATLRARGVELVPQPGGVRAVAGHLELTAASQRAGRKAEVTLTLGRAAADLRLPRMSVERLLAVGGSGALRVRGDGTHQPDEAEVAITELSLARIGPGAPLAARATLDDHGVPRAVELRLTSRPTPALQLASPRLPLWPLAPLMPAWLALGDAHFSGELALSRGVDDGDGDGDDQPTDGTEAAHAIGLVAKGQLERAGVQHPVVAAAPVELSAGFDGTARLAPRAAGGFEASATGRYRLGSAAPGASPGATSPAPSVTGAASLAVHRGAPTAASTAPVVATVELTLDRAACVDLLASVPRGLRAPLEGMLLAGQLGGRMHISVDTSAPLGEGAEVTAEPEGSCQVLAEPPGADVAALLEPREHTFPDGSRAAVGPGVGSWVELRRLPGHVDGAFVAAEDARFFDHGGFDMAQIAKSLEIDLREERLARGGSTISQQLIKNAFLDGKRSAARKLNEAVLTWRLEARLAKREILERYLNIIELGPSIYGLAAAAQHWFGRSPTQLTVRQAAFLAALTPEPTTMTRRIIAARGLDRASAARVETVLRAMKRQGLIDQASLELARHAELDFRSAALRPTATATLAP